MVPDLQEEGQEWGEALAGWVALEPDQVVTVSVPIAVGRFPINAVFRVIRSSAPVVGRLWSENGEERINREKISHGRKG